jgi:hypothetical protein
MHSGETLPLSFNPCTQGFEKIEQRVVPSRLKQFIWTTRISLKAVVETTWYEGRAEASPLRVDSLLVHALILVEGLHLIVPHVNNFQHIRPKHKTRPKEKSRVSSAVAGRCLNNFCLFATNTRRRRHTWK